jgi:HEAT repeat protein
MPGLVERMRNYSISAEIKNLADEDGRRGAIRTLKAFGEPAIPFLIDVLGDQSRSGYAVIILSEIGEPAIPALLDVLSDNSKSGYASAALNEMGKKKNKTQMIIIPRLIDALADKGKQAIASVTLQNFGAPTLEPFIPALINNIGNVDASLSAAKVLIGIGKPAVGPLMNAASDESIQELVNIILREIAKKDNTVPIPITVSQKQPIPSSTPNQSPKPKFCRSCGASLTLDSAYCPQCGKKIE